MATRQNGAELRRLRTLFNLGAIGELTDGQLVERFLTRGGEAAELAFAALVERHGPMVLRVCRHALRDHHDAQDAFQATFLVLVQKARSLWVQDSIGPWLHRVAYRVASRARSSKARRREHEERAGAMSPAFVSPERGDWEDTVTVLHEEIDRLPERYRVLVVLCDLQGLSHEKAARHLGWPVGTVKSRLARAREILRGRLRRRGQGLSAARPVVNGLGLTLPFRSVEVVLPGHLVDSTVRAAAPFAAGKAFAVGAISARVAILIEEVQRTMFFTKLKLASAFILIAGGIAAGTAGVLAQSGAGSGANRSPASAAELSGQTERNQFQGQGPAPAYISRSRAMIVTRLEEESAEAKARLDRIVRKVPSPDDPAVVRARRTVEALDQLLDRIDVVLVDAVERYPTMFDFSGAPAVMAPTEQVGLGPSQAKDDDKSQPAASSTGADLERAWDRVEWARRMFEKGYASRSQLATELANYNYEAVKARTEGRSQSQMGAQQPGQNTQQSSAGPQKAGQQGQEQGEKGLQRPGQNGQGGQRNKQGTGAQSQGQNEQNGSQQRAWDSWSTDYSIQGQGQNKQSGSQQAGPRDQQSSDPQTKQGNKAPQAQPGQPQHNQQPRQNQPAGQQGQGRQEADHGLNTNQVRDHARQPLKP